MIRKVTAALPRGSEVSGVWEVRCQRSAGGDNTPIMHCLQVTSSGGRDYCHFLSLSLYLLPGEQWSKSAVGSAALQWQLVVLQADRAPSGGCCRGGCDVTFILKLDERSKPENDNQTTKNSECLKHCERMNHRFLPNHRELNHTQAPPRFSKGTPPH